MSTLESISTMLQQGRAPKVKELVAQAVSEGLGAQEILENGLMAGMDIIGGKFKRNEVFVPEVLVAARAMNAGIEVLKPYLVESGVKSRGTVVIGTAKGDPHDIGKNLVRMMMESKGLTVVDIGVDVPAEKYVEAAIQNNASIIACSALLTTTMNQMKTVVEEVKKSSLAGKVKIMVGGAPITQHFSDSIGADAFTPDASSAAEKALELCTGLAS